MPAFRILIILGSYTVACFGAGALVLRALRVPTGSQKTFSTGTELASAFILGEGALASFWLLVALADGFSRILVIACTTVCALGGLVWLLPRSRDFARQVRSIWSELRAETWGWQALGVLTLALCAAWVTSVGRPITGDAQAFYMALPKVIAASHRLVPLSGYAAFTSVGLQGEMHYAALMSLGSPDAAQLFAWPSMLAGAVILLALGRQLGLGRRGQWIALVILFTSSAVYNLSGDGKTDLFAAALGLAAYYWLSQIRHGAQRFAAWLTGLFCGFAITAKLSYIPAMAPGMLLLLIWGFREDLFEPGQRKKAIVLLLMTGGQIAAALLIAMTPQFIKNGLLYSNPLAPFGSGSLVFSQTWFSPLTTRHILLTYPLALIFGNYWAQYGGLSPLVLAFLPLALLLPRARNRFLSPLSAVTLAATVGLISWMALEPSVFAPRYILATLLLFIFLPARAAEYVSQNDSRPRWLTFGTMFCSMTTLIAAGLVSLNTVFFPYVTYRYLSGQYLSGKLPDCYREAEPQCNAMLVINRDAPPGARVLMASFYRYWLRADLLQCADRADEPWNESLGNTPAASWEKYYRMGFSYIFADRSTHSQMIDNLNLEDPPPWLELVVLFQHDPITVYRLDVTQPPAPQMVVCRQVNPPSWDVVLR